MYVLVYALHRNERLRIEKRVERYTQQGKKLMKNPKKKKSYCGITKKREIERMVCVCVCARVCAACVYLYCVYMKLTLAYWLRESSDIYVYYVCLLEVLGLPIETAISLLYRICQ